MILLMGFVLPLSAQDDSTVEDPTVHVVQPGENLYRIALRYGVSMDAIVQANEITNSSVVYRGQTLIIPGLDAPDDGASVDNPLVAGTPVTHVVNRGESLTIIAQRYNTTVEQILQANNITNANRIFPGQQLNVWTTESVNQPLAQEPVAMDVVPQEPVMSDVPGAINSTYTVQPGENLSQIAGRFNVDWRTVAQMNGIVDPNNIEAGVQLIIPAVNAQGGAVDLGIVSQPFNVPVPTITTGKQIIIDLSDSRIYAYEDGVLVYSALGSTGLPATPTVIGDFEIYNRVRSQTMSGPDYYLPNVEWVLYFYRGYAIHGTYWHSNWGQPMSHGCVNLTNEDARWFFENFGAIGTPVRVQR